MVDLDYKKSARPASTTLHRKSATGGPDGPGASGRLTAERATVTNGTAPTRPGRVTRGTYIGGFVVEVLVLAGIWILQRYFASS